MRRTRSAILALSLLGVFPHAAWAQVGPAPTDAVAVSATVGVSAEAPAVGVTADVSAAAAGGGSGASSVDAAATVRTSAADASASATVVADRAGGPEAALQAAVGAKTSPEARRLAPEPASDELPAPSTRENGPTAEPRKAKSTDVPPRAERTRKAREPALRAAPDGVERASLSVELDPAPSAPRSAQDVDSNAGGPSPDEVAPSAAGVSAAATLLSLAILLIPLASWAIEHASAGSARRLFLSLLERPG